MNPQIVKADSLNEYLTAERCFIAENYSAADGKVSIAKARVNPGVTTVAHHLEVLRKFTLLLKAKA